MKRIEKLIKEKCSSDTKKYFLYELEEMQIIELGRGNIISKKDIIECPGDYPVYSSSSSDNGEIGRYGKYMFEDIRISWSIDGGGKFFYRDVPRYSITNVSGWIKVINENFVLTKYLYYILTNEWLKKNYDYSHKAHPSVIKKEYEIFIPPLDVQKEIVMFLDKFGKLDSELKHELEMRQMQYSFWRDKIFNEIDVKYPKIKFGNFVTVKRGGNFQKSDLLDSGYPCIHYGQIYMKYGLFANNVFSYLNRSIYDKQKKAKKNDIIMAVTSENMEDVCKSVVWLGDCDVAISGHTAIISSNQNGKYLAYYFQSKIFQSIKCKYARGVKVIEFQPNKLLDIEIALPPIDIQEQVVKFLDKFDKLINDVYEGLPAEIYLRQKQYAYYRNKLLNFNEVLSNE